MNTYSYLKSNINSIADRWIQGLKDLKEINHKESRLDHIQYLESLYDEASEMYELYSQELHPVVLARLQHIINRPFKSHLITTNIKD